MAWCDAPVWSGATPLGLMIFWDRIPGVARGAGNPGLRGGTSSRFWDGERRRGSQMAKCLRPREVSGRRIPTGFRRSAQGWAAKRTYPGFSRCPRCETPSGFRHAMAWFRHATAWCDVPVWLGATPLGLVIFWDRFPRVARGAGNPGLRDGTSSRFWDGEPLRGSQTAKCLRPREVSVLRIPTGFRRSAQLGREADLPWVRGNPASAGKCAEHRGDDHKKQDHGIDLKGKIILGVSQAPHQPDPAQGHETSHQRRTLAQP